MGRFRWLGAAVLAGVMLLASVAQADARIDFLIEKLKSDDFKVRTNAALALGNTNDDAAVQPLCGALSDDNDVVRQASAAALKKLGRSSSLGCLKSRLPIESSDNVKAAINRAIESIDASGGGGGNGGGGGDPGAPKNNPNAKFYISLSNIENKSQRSQSEIDSVVYAAVNKKLDSLGQYQVAPAKESQESARAVMAKRNLKGFYLQILVEKIEYSGDSLTVAVRMVVFTYPGKAMKGAVPLMRSTANGVSGPDKSTEDTLLTTAAGAAINKFAQNIDAFVD